MTWFAPCCLWAGPPNAHARPLLKRSWYSAAAGSELARMTTGASKRALRGTRYLQGEISTRNLAGLSALEQVLITGEPSGNKSVARQDSGNNWPLAWTGMLLEMLSEI